MIEPIHEFNLKGHLLEKGKTTAGTEAVVDATDNDYNNSTLVKLANTDFQLYEALKILKGMYKQASDDSLLNQPNNPTSAQK